VSAHRLAAAGSVLLVGIAIMAGLYFAGSPAEQRLLRLDMRRINDLRRLASVVSTYRTQTSRLPSNLDQLLDGRRLSQLPLDPETDALYGYEIEEDERFRLCARFSRASVGAGNDFWDHEAGPQCFEFDLSDLE
jgi:hypothetical protein